MCEAITQASAKRKERIEEHIKQGFAVIENLLETNYDLELRKHIITIE